MSSIFANLFERKRKTNKGDKYKLNELTSTVKGISAEDIKLGIRNSKTPRRSVSLGLQSSHIPSAPPLSRATSRHLPSAPPLSRATSSHIPSAPPLPLSIEPSRHNGGKKKKATPESAAGKRKK